MTTPSLIDLTVAEFTDRLAGESLPGGGSAAALAGAQGAALAAMVARLTAGRPRSAEHEAEAAAIRDAADALRARLLALVDTDTRAYQEVMAAYRKPKESDLQAVRHEAIQMAMRRATELQLEVAGLCLEALRLAAAAASRGARSAAGDAAAGALLAHAGLQSATRNVRTNLAAIRAADYCAMIGGRADEIAAAGEIALAHGLAAADAAAPGASQGDAPQGGA